MKSSQLSADFGSELLLYGEGSDLLSSNEEVNSITQRLRKHLLVVSCVLQDRDQADDMMVAYFHVWQHVGEKSIELLVSGCLVLPDKLVKKLIKVGLSDIHLVKGVEAGHFG